MPEIPKSAEIGDLFANFAVNWGTLMPVLVLLFGILFGSFVAIRIKKNME